VGIFLIFQEFGLGSFANTLAVGTADELDGDPASSFAFGLDWRLRLRLLFIL